MGTTLTGKRVQNTYDSLLKITDNDNLTGVPKRITSGLGTDSPIFLSTDKIGIGMSPTAQFQTSGNAEIGNNLVVGGNLTVNGTTTFIDSTIVEIGDNMIELAKDNTANTKDIGWYGTINDGSEKYVGVFYDASTGTTTPEFKIGIGSTEPGNTAAWTTKGKLIIGDIDSTGGTFSGHITIPETPTADGHAASKKYVDDSTTSSETAERIEITVKNKSGATLSKGVVVHVSPTASPPSGNVVEVIKADYDDADKMPAIGILKESIANDNEGTAVMFGALSGLDTSSFSAGDELYVGNDGAFTNTKPTATTQLVQKIAVVVKSHASNGLIKIFGAGRSNDVPNKIERDVTFDGGNLIFQPNADIILGGDDTYNSTINYVDNGAGDHYLVFQTKHNGTSDDTLKLHGQTKLASFSGNVDIDGNLSVDDSINVEAASGYGRLEVGGPDGGYIDLKTPFSDDYDLRIITNSSGSEFTGSGDFNLNAGNSLTLTLDGTTQAATFAGDVYVGNATTNGGVINLIQSTTNPEIRIQSGESGTTAFSIYNTATNPDSEQFFINNTLATSHLGNKRGALKLETNSGVVLTLSGSDATFAGSIITQSDSSIFGGSGTVPLYVRSSGTVSFAQFQTSSTGSNLTNDGLSVGVNGLNAYVWQRENANLYLGTNNTLALTLDNSQNATFAGDLTVSGGDITLGGTGRIQGIDTITDGTDAVNKNYVDDNFVDGSGTANDVAMWLDSDTLTDAPIAISGNDATFAGDINIGNNQLKQDANSYLTFDDDTTTYNPDTNVATLASVSGIALATNTNDGGGGTFTISTGSTGTELFKILTSGNSNLNGDLTLGTNDFTAGTATIGGILLEDSSDRSGLLEINRKGTTSWSGIQVKHGELWSWMGNGQYAGLYDDTRDDWIYLHDSDTGNTEYKWRNSTKMTITTGGLSMSGTITSRSITPETDSTYNIGTDAVRFANVWADNINGGTPVNGSGTANDVAMWSDEDTLTDAPIAISGNNATFAGKVGINMAPESAYQFATYYQQTNPNDDFRFAHYINADFSGADNTTADREQGGIFMDIDSSADGDASNEHRLYGIYIDQRFTGYSDLSFGVYSRVESNNNTEKTASMVGVYGYAVHDSGAAGGVSTMYGTRGIAQVEDDGDVDNSYGVHGQTIIASTRAVNVDATYGGYFEVQIDSPNAITYGDMISVRSTIDNNEGTVPTFGNQYLYFGDYQGTKGSNAYGLYLYAEDKNYLSGKLGIANANPQALLHLGGSTPVGAEALIARGNTDNTYVVSVEQDHATGWGMIIDTDATDADSPALKITNPSGTLFEVASNGDVEINGDVTINGIDNATAPDADRVLVTSDTSGEIQYRTTAQLADDMNVPTGIGGAGLIPIYETSSTFTTGSLYWDIANGRLGINQISPAERLHVGGNAKIEGDINVDGASFTLGTAAYEKVLFESNPSSHDGNGSLFIEPQTAPGSGTANFYTRFSNKVAGGTTRHHVQIASGSNLYFGGSLHTYIGEDIDDRLRFFCGGSEFMRFTEGANDYLEVYKPLRIQTDQILFNNDSASARIRATDALILESDWDNDDSADKPIYFYQNGSEMGKVYLGGISHQGSYSYLSLNGSSESGWNIYAPNDAYAHMDVRTHDTDSAIPHKYIRNSANTGYRPYYENWYSGSAYVSFGAVGTNWRFFNPITMQDNIDIYLWHSNGSGSAGKLHVPRAGAITFYGDASKNHSIMSTNSAGATADDIRINSYGAVTINLDSNNNNTSGADFMIGRHGSHAGSVSQHFIMSGENGNVNFGSGSVASNTKVLVRSTNNYDISSSTGMGGIKITEGTSGNGNYTGGIGFSFTSGTAGICGKQGSADSDNMGLAFFTHPSSTGSNPAVEQMILASDGDLQIARYLEHKGYTNSYLGWAAADDFRIVVGGRELVRLDEGTDPDIAKFMTDEFRMYSSGDFHADGDIIAYSTTTSSDKRLKKDIKPIDNALDIVEKLQGVHFNWKENDEKSIGYIAQDVEKILPEMVKEKTHFDKGEFKTVNYAAMVSIMGEAIKELSAKVGALENKKCNCNCK